MPPFQMAPFQALHTSSALSVLVPTKNVTLSKALNEIHFAISQVISNDSLQLSARTDSSVHVGHSGRSQQQFRAVIYIISKFMDLTSAPLAEAEAVGARPLVKDFS